MKRNQVGELPVHYSGHTGLFQKSSLKLNTPKTTPDDIFLKPDDVYLACGDRMDLVLKNMVNLKQTRMDKIDIYASVIGGLSGLNYLSYFKPNEIVIFDINPSMVEYAKFICEMINICDSPQEFISRILSRKINSFLLETGALDLNFENQNRYFKLPVDKELLKETLSQLSIRGKNTYETFIVPHLPGIVLNGVMNCRRLLPCWPVNERVPVGGGEAMGYDEHNQLVPNTNTFFTEKGG